MTKQVSGRPNILSRLGKNNKKKNQDQMTVIISPTISMASVSTLTSQLSERTAGLISDHITSSLLPMNMMVNDNDISIGTLSSPFVVEVSNLHPDASADDVRVSFYYTKSICNY